MGKEAINEYTAMRDAIQGNIDAIRSLIDQATQLTSTIALVTDPAIKQTLTDQARSLDDSIGHLVGETDKLFKMYINLANSVVIVPS